jgi:hypothetical protein
VPAKHELDTPANNLSFLELYHKSALRVEEYSNSLKKVSLYTGVFATVCFTVAAISFIGNDIQAQAVNSGKHNLKSEQV